MKTSKKNNGDSQAAGPDSNPEGPRGTLVPVNRVLPLRVGSDEVDGSFPATMQTESAGVAGMFKALQQRWLLALVAGSICGAIGGAAMWYLKPANYTVVALLRVSASEHRLLEGEKENDLARMTYMKTQAALIRSRPIIRVALEPTEVRQLELVKQHPQREAWLEKELKVGYIDDTDILSISLTGTAPKDMEMLVNAIQKSYMDQIVDAEHKRQLHLKQDLERIILTANDKLREQRKELRTLAEIHHNGDSQTLTVKQKHTLEEYAALSRESLGVNAQLRLAKMRLETQKARLKSIENAPVPETMVSQYLDLDTGIQMQMLEVTRAQTHALTTEQTTSEGSPLRKKPQQALAFAKETLEKIRQTKRPDIVKRLRQKSREETESTIGQMQEELDILEHQKKSMELEVKRVKGEAEQIGSSSLDFEMKKAEIEQTESVVKQLSHEKEKLSIELQSTDSNRITLHQRAEAPEIANVKEHIQESVLAGLCAMSLGIFCVGFWEFRARWVSTTDDVSRDLGMRVVGTLPDLSSWTGRSNPRLVAPEENDSARMMLESVDSIRAILTCDESADSTRVLMITSAVSREGKTTLAAQLATSFAHSGRRTILVDFDLRNPSLHRLLDLPQTPGVCEVLRGEIDVADAVVATEVPGLFFLPAGSLTRPVLASCLQDSGEALFQYFRSEYQFVAIDTCPVLPVPDSLLLGRFVDAAVFSIRTRVSRFPSVLAACERLKSVRIPLLGTVVNGVRPKKDHEYYRYVSQAAS
jgi:succinoglycan biosynthesis transport protein ExoP